MVWVGKAGLFFNINTHQHWYQPKPAPSLERLQHQAVASTTQKAAGDYVQHQAMQAARSTTVV
jgi:hypothetical protein